MYFVSNSTFGIDGSYNSIFNSFWGIIFQNGHTILHSHQCVGIFLHIFTILLLWIERQAHICEHRVSGWLCGLGRLWNLGGGASLEEVGAGVGP